MVVTLDRLFTSAEAGIAVVPSKDTVSAAVVALRANAEAIAEVGVLVSAVCIA